MAVCWHQTSVNTKAITKISNYVNKECVKIGSSQNLKMVGHENATEWTCRTWNLVKWKEKKKNTHLAVREEKIAKSKTEKLT